MQRKHDGNHQARCRHSYQVSRYSEKTRNGLVANHDRKRTLCNHYNARPGPQNGTAHEAQSRQMIGTTSYVVHYYYASHTAIALDIARIAFGPGTKPTR